MSDEYSNSYGNFFSSPGDRIIIKEVKLPTTKKKEEVEKIVAINEVENYLTQNLLAVYLLGENPFGYITREYFENFTFCEDFANCIIVDILNKNSYDCNGHGEIIGSRVSSAIESAITIYHVFSDIPQSDFFGDPIEIPNIEKKEETKNNYPGVPINVSYLSMIDSNIREFYCVDSSKVEFESNVERLIKTAIIDPDQFDEIFTIETDRPESPLMRKFLVRLAQLVNEGLETLKDEGLEDLTELQKIAYKYAGYKGKSFETVVEEQKDYDSYFRFLLTKDEKIVITEKQKEYFDKLKVLAKKEIANNYIFISNKKRTKDVIFSGLSVCPSFTGQYYFTGLVPSLLTSKVEIKATYFTYIDDIHDIYSEIEKSKLSLKIALNSDLIIENNSDIKKGVELKNLVFVCDKNFNYGFFEVKKSTLNKWKKSLSEKVVEMSIAISTKSTALRGFNELVL